MMIDTREGIELYRLLTIQAGLKLEVKGMRLTNKARSCYAIAKSQFGFKGNKEKVLAQVTALIEQVKTEQGGVPMRREDKGVCDGCGKPDHPFVGCAPVGVA